MTDHQQRSRILLDGTSSPAVEYMHQDSKSKDCAENSKSLNNVDTADEFQHLTE